MPTFQVIGWVTWGDDSEKPAVSWRMLRFPDQSQARVTGLNEVLAGLYSEGRQPTTQTAEEILERLEKSNNYIPPTARREYRSAVLKEYAEYVDARKNKDIK